MGHRLVSGLKWARHLGARPTFIPLSRLHNQSQSAGLRYERSCGSAIPSAKAGQWFEFEDRNGLGWCCPDLVIELDRQIVVIECKLSDTIKGVRQLEELYFPVLSMAYSRPVIGFVMTKNLKPGVDLRLVSDNLAEVIDLAQFSVPILHWLGRAPIPLTRATNPESSRAQTPPQLP